MAKKRNIQPTGCEAIWNQSNRGCYLHTQSISHGNGVGNHVCWTFPETSHMDNGFCVKADGGDQNSGVIKLYSKDAGPSDSLLQECHKTCDSESKKRNIQGTGCEAIWNQSNRGCYLHTHSISHGNGVGNHACWVNSPTIHSMNNAEEPGFCVKADGGDQNSGVILLYSKDAGPSDSLLQECHKTCDSESKKRNVEG